MTLSFPVFLVLKSVSLCNFHSSSSRSICAQSYERMPTCRLKNVLLDPKSTVSKSWIFVKWLQASELRFGGSFPSNGAGSKPRFLCSVGCANAGAFWHFCPWRTYFCSTVADRCQTRGCGLNTNFVQLCESLASRSMTPPWGHGASRRRKNSQPGACSKEVPFPLGSPLRTHVGLTAWPLTADRSPALGTSWEWWLFFTFSNVRGLILWFWQVICHVGTWRGSRDEQAKMLLMWSEKAVTAILKCARLRKRSKGNCVEGWRLNKEERAESSCGFRSRQSEVR